MCQPSGPVFRHAPWRIWPMRTQRCLGCSVLSGTRDLLVYCLYHRAPELPLDEFHPCRAAWRETLWMVRHGNSAFSYSPDHPLAAFLLVSALRLLEMGQRGTHRVVVIVPPVVMQSLRDLLGSQRHAC